MAETAAARRWLDSQIAPIVTDAGWVWTPPEGDEEPRLFNGSAPEGAPLPLVIYQNLSPGNDVRVLNGNHVWSDTLWLVKVIAEGTSTTGVEAVVDDIHAALHNQKGSVSGGTIVRCYRERPHELPLPPIDGRAFIALGGEYRVLTQEA